MKKICIIREMMQGTMYMLHVDNQEIAFIGKWGVDYFEKHYKEFGYEVKKEFYKDEQ